MLDHQLEGRVARSRVIRQRAGEHDRRWLAARGRVRLGGLVVSGRARRGDCRDGETDCQVFSETHPVTSVGEEGSPL